MANDIDSVLGKEVDYKFQYNPQILAREPRVKNRLIYGFDDEHLPFNAGKDVWHAYECSFLLGNNCPVNGVLKIVIPATSKYIVESKSLKLYLFSFNMSIIEGTVSEAIAKFETTVQRDLANLLEVDIEDIGIHLTTDINSGINIRCLTSEIYSDISELMQQQMVFSSFTENPDLLHDGDHKFLRIRSDALRSNCKITHQPDWGTVYIHMDCTDGAWADLRSVAEYIVSFRGENHFHEEIVECMYSRLWSKFKPKQLMVTALYTRRGGIDICPSRASHPSLLFENLIDPKVLTTKEYRS